MRRETSYDVLRRPTSRSGCRCRAELIAISHLEPTTETGVPEHVCRDFFGHLTVEKLLPRRFAVTSRYRSCGSKPAENLSAALSTWPLISTNPERQP